VSEAEVSGFERRAHVRQRVSRVEVRVASRESFRASYLRDLSMGGLFVRSRQPLPRGTAVVVELSVDSQSPARLRGEVMRQEHAPDGTPRGFGVRFSTVDEDTRMTLENILRAHQQPQPWVPTGPEALDTQLAEARGTIEAYEETLALLRESEMETAQRLEAVEAERGLMESVAHELMARVQRGEAEALALRAQMVQLTVELDAARQLVANAATEHSGVSHRMLAEFEAEQQKTAALDAEVQTIRAQLEAKDEGPLRSELQELSIQLDDERLKSMALERALQRFVEMGGIPPRAP
jgi:uncharacterized protein (TIGR02266 family)